MKAMIWVMGLVLFLSGSTTFAKSDSNGKNGKKNRQRECVRPAPGYGGQAERGKSNNGHGNNEDDVDKSNPGRSKTGEDTDPDVDDEKKK